MRPTIVAAGAAPRHALVFERDGEIVLQSAGAGIENAKAAKVLAKGAEIIPFAPR